jgi:hypothetical protein
MGWQNNRRSLFRALWSHISDDHLTNVDEMWLSYGRWTSDRDGFGGARPGGEIQNACIRRVRDVLQEWMGIYRKKLYCESSFISFSGRLEILRREGVPQESSFHDRAIGRNGLIVTKGKHWLIKLSSFFWAAVATSAATTPCRHLQLHCQGRVHVWPSESIVFQQQPTTIYLQPTS